MSSFSTLILTWLMASSTPSGETVEYTYDPIGRLTRVDHSGAVNHGVAVLYEYDDANARTRRRTVGAP